MCAQISDPELISRVQLVKRDGTHFHIVRPEHALRRLAENSTLIGWTLDFDCCLQEHLARTRSEPVSALRCWGWWTPDLGYAVPLVLGGDGPTDELLRGCAEIRNSENGRN